MDIIEYGHGVLMIDNDHQRNLSRLLMGAVDSIDESQTLKEIYEKMPLPEVVIHESKYEGVYLVPSTKELIGERVAIGNGKDSQMILRRWLLNHKEVLEEKYGINTIVIDCSPSSGILNSNAMEAATDMIVVVVPSEQALEGLLDLNVYLFDRNKSTYILFNMYRKEDDASSEMLGFFSDRKNGYKSMLFKNPIHYNEVVRNSLYGKKVPVCDFCDSNEPDEIEAYENFDYIVEQLIKKGSLEDVRE